MRILLALLFAVLVGCSQPTESVPPESPSNETVYLQTVRGQYPVLDTVDDQTLIETAVNSCAALDAGVQIEELFQVTIDAGLPPEMGGTIIGAGIAAYCPEHGKDL